jgi:hypothetical protein
VEYEIENLGSLKYYLAPKINENAEWYGGIMRRSLPSIDLIYLFLRALII